MISLVGGALERLVTHDGLEVHSVGALLPEGRDGLGQHSHHNGVSAGGGRCQRRGVYNHLGMFGGESLGSGGSLDQRHGLVSKIEDDVVRGARRLEVVPLLLGLLDRCLGPGFSLASCVAQPAVLRGLG